VVRHTEFKLVKVSNDTNFGRTEQLLNELAVDGWEFVAAVGQCVLMGKSGRIEESVVEQPIDYKPKDDPRWEAR